MENAHKPTRERERRRRRFKSSGQAQRFLAADGPTATIYRQIRDERFATWRSVTGTPPWSSDQRPFPQYAFVRRQLHPFDFT